MENDQNMNNNDPLNTAGSDNSNNTNTYVRADDTVSDADVTRLAQPVGESYEGATYVRAEEARATAEPEQEHTAQATQAEPEGAAQSASASADAERVQA